MTITARQNFAEKHRTLLHKCFLLLKRSMLSVTNKYYYIYIINRKNTPFQDTNGETCFRFDAVKTDISKLI